MSENQGWIGRSLRRREDLPLITGKGLFSADAEPPGCLRLAVRRAGVPRARGLKVDVGPARELPGVVGAWKFGELGFADEFMPDPAPASPPVRRPLLARDEVHFEGDAVAVVVAQTEYQADDAAAAVEVDFDPLLPEESPVRPMSFRFGDPSAAFESAEVVASAELRMGRICGAAIEPRAVTAEWREREQQLWIRASMGWVFALRDAVAACLGLEPSQVVAVSTDVGGSFGAKNHPYPEYLLAAAASRLLGRPVKWVASRSEDGLTTAQSHAVSGSMELAAAADGTLRGLRGTVDWPIGAYLTRGAMQAPTMASHMVSGYCLPALDVEVRGHLSDTPPASFIRGGGRPVGNFMVERMMDRLARRLGMDPIELRRRNLIPPEAMPHPIGLDGIVYDGGDFPRLLQLATEGADVAGLRRRQASGEPVGVGVAMCVESTGIGAAEPSKVRVGRDGSVTVLIGSTPQGQGHRTFAAQVAADRLQWPIEKIVVEAGDSRAVPFSAVTAGSRSALEVGNSVAISAAEARRLLLERAADRLEAAAEDMVLGPDGAHVRGVPARQIALKDLVQDGLEGAGTWNSQGAKAWASSCHVATVRLDVETGAVTMEGYLIAHDSGRVINPMMVEGQLHGGYAHGLGYALFEEALFSEEGYNITPSFLTYTIASAPELSAELRLIHVEGQTSHNPEGFRGVGEAGTIAVPAAVANAVEDALLALGHDTLVDTVPITPERLWRLVQK